jgi:LppP/LprE lipoprotein
VLVLGTLAGALAGGCGSSTKTVSVAGAPPQTTGTTAATTQPSQSTGSASGGSTTAQRSPSGGTPAPTGTRSASEPAFTHQETGAEGLGGAVATVRARGFTPNNTSDYHPSQTLRVLIGTRTGSGDGYGQQAFFFVNGRYIGTDASQPSATLRVESQGDTEVALAYPLYRKGDPLCCPGGGQAVVHFQLNNGKLAPLEPIPPSSSSSSLSRQ